MTEPDWVGEVILGYPHAPFPGTGGIQICVCGDEILLAVRYLQHTGLAKLTVEEASAFVDQLTKAAAKAGAQ